jgi:hypothetical protein
MSGSTARSSRFEQHIWAYYLHPSRRQQHTMSASSTSTSTTPAPTTATTTVHPFWNLPRELQLAILDYLPLFDYITFSLVTYAHLRLTYPSYFPAITLPRLRALRTPPPRPDPFANLPNEMIMTIAGFIDRREVLGWVLAHYWTLERANPPLVPRWGEVGRGLWGCWVKVDCPRP